MEKHFIVLCTMALLLSACSSPLLNSGASGSSAPGTSSIQVSFPTTTARAGLIDVTKASTNSNFYELVAYNATNLYFINSNTVSKASSSGGTITNVAPGTYTVVALAGLSTGDNLSLSTVTSRVPSFTFYGSAANAPYVVLLGSAVQTGVVVTAGSTATASLTLTNVLFNIASSGTAVNSNTFTVPVNSAYTITWTGDTGSANLVTEAAGSSMLWAFYGSAPSNLTGSSGGQSWTVATSWTAPGSSGSTTVAMANYAGALLLLDATNGYSSPGKYLASLTGTYWSVLPNDSLSGYSSYNASLAPGKVVVNFSTGGVSAGVTWGTGR